jgi:hypothetical protein
MYCAFLNVLTGVLLYVQESLWSVSLQTEFCEEKRFVFFSRTGELSVPEEYSALLEASL